MTIATLRPDGWPQATTVGYVNEGMTVYFMCGRESQKAHNLAGDSRVSVTIDHDASNLAEISGLNMAAHARLVDDDAEKARLLKKLPERYPEQAVSELAEFSLDDVHVYRLEPKMISVLDYSKGFGHTELVTC